MNSTAASSDACDRPIDDLETVWDRIRSAALANDALLVPGELVGTGFSVELEPTQSDVLLTLLGRSATPLLYVLEERWDTDGYDSELGIIDAARHELAQDDDEDDDDLFDAAAYAELTAAASSAAEVARQQLVATRPHLGRLSSVVLTAVVNGVSHTLTLLAPWRDLSVSALCDLDDAMAAWRNPPALRLSEAEQALSWERRQAQRLAEQQEHEAAVAEAGRQLFDVLLADASFRSTKAEPARWQRAQVLLRPLMTWPELSQFDRGELRRVAREAWEHLSVEVAGRLRTEVSRDLVEHAQALRARPEWMSATTVNARRRAARAYLEGLDPLINEVALADLLAGQALAADGAPDGSGQAELL